MLPGVARQQEPQEAREAGILIMLLQQRLEFLNEVVVEKLKVEIGIEQKLLLFPLELLFLCCNVLEYSQRVYGLGLFAELFNFDFRKDQWNLFGGTCLSHEGAFVWGTERHVAFVQGRFLNIGIVYFGFLSGSSNCEVLLELLQ